MSDERFQLFLASLESRGRSPNTLRAYRLDWQHFTRWYAVANQEPFTFERLASLDVRDYVQWGQSQGFKPATINRRLGLLKQVCDWAAKQHGFDPVRADAIRSIPIVKKQMLAPKALQSDDVRRLLKEIEISGTIRDRAIILTLLYTGLRVGELVALTTSDIHLTERKGHILIRSNISKGGKERKVPVPKRARESLLHYIDQRRQKVDFTDHSPLFVGREGALSTAGVAAMLRKYARRASIEYLTPHTLRHTFAYTYLQNNQNDLVGLAEILGHSDLNTTQIYTRHTLDALQDGVERLKFF